MRKSILSSILTLSFAACGGDSSSSVGLAVGATSSSHAAMTDEGTDTSSTALRFADDAGTEYSLTRAMVVLRDIELDLPDGARCADVEDELEGAECDDSEVGDDSDKVRIPGPFAIDLLTRTATPSLDGVRIAAGAYRRIDFRIDDGDPSDGVVAAGSELDDVSMVVSADFTHDGLPATLDLRLKFNEDVRLEADEDIAVEAEGAKLLLQLDAALWLAGVDIGACLENGDLAFDGNSLVIDEASGSGGTGGCSDIENTIKSNVKTSGQLDRD